MDEPATTDAPHEAAPDRPCVFVFGGTGPYTVNDLLTRGAGDVLGKPVAMDRLGRGGDGRGDGRTGRGMWPPDGSTPTVPAPILNESARNPRIVLDHPLPPASLTPSPGRHRPSP